MNMDERIARINALYHKSQKDGLTDAEKEEQARLRKEYVASVRANLRGQLDSITIEKPDGTKENLGEKYGKKTSYIKDPDGAARGPQDEHSRIVSESKREIRKRILKIRDELDDKERERGTLLMTERILGHQWFYRSEIILGFASYGSEIGTWELLREALRLGKRVYLPKVAGEGEQARMFFFRIMGLEELKTGYRGIPEPEGDSEEYIYREDEADHTLMLMPGAAFDPYRNRIGYGKGFYDRFLADKEALRLRTIAVGYRCQLVDEIPAEERDVRPYQVICV